MEISTLYNELGKETIYDCKLLNVFPYCKTTDIVEGIQLNLSNMSGDFPFSLYNIPFACNEILYLCGQFSYPHLTSIQHELYSAKNGFSAKRFIKNKYKGYIRDDFQNFRNDWMLWVCWQKCLTNYNFRLKLLTIPNDAILIEDTTTSHSSSKSIWGAVNKELHNKRKEIEKEIIEKNTKLSKQKLGILISEETNKVRNVGSFIGENNMGKILMICKKCLEKGDVPPFNKELLNSSNIHLFGTKLIF